MIMASVSSSSFSLVSNVSPIATYSSHKFCATKPFNSGKKGDLEGERTFDLCHDERVRACVCVCWEESVCVCWGKVCVCVLGPGGKYVCVGGSNLGLKAW